MALRLNELRTLCDPPWGMTTDYREGGYFRIERSDGHLSPPTAPSKITVMIINAIVMADCEAQLSLNGDLDSFQR